jgi:hypothetical protein
MKPRIPRIGVRQLMLIVFLVAVDFTIVRVMYEAKRDLGIACVVLPMANLLVLVAPKAWGGASRPFWIGFEVAGWCSVGLFGYLSHFHGATFFQPANTLYPWATIRNPLAQWACIFVLDQICYTPPLVFLGWLGGRLLARFSAWRRSREPIPPNEP